MNWRLRAFLLRAMSKGSVGASVYRFLQKHKGTHLQPDFALDKIKEQCSLAEMMRANGTEVRGARLVEVGTGWVPLAPLGFWMCGAERIDTFDLTRFLLPEVLTRRLRGICEEPEPFIEQWREFAETDEITRKLAIIDDLKEKPLELLEQAGIHYHAPGDASQTGLEDSSVDGHFSISVFEHVAPQFFKPILDEAARILKPDGVAVHRMDPTDHFSHFDPDISSINFLQFNDRQWSRLADGLAYHNRLRPSMVRPYFDEKELPLVSAEAITNERSLATVANGFDLDERFRGLDADDLCCELVDFVAKPAMAMQH